MPMSTASRRRWLLVFAVWLDLCVVGGVLRTADELKAPVRDLWAGVRGLYSSRP